jgi:hypothetical protein
MLTRRKSLNAKPAVVVFLSILVGLGITWVSELFSTQSIDVVYRGFPWAWIIQVIPRPPHILWTSFIADAAFWSVITYVIFTLILHVLTRSQRPINPSER